MQYLPIWPKAISPHKHTLEVIISIRFGIFSTLLHPRISQWLWFSSSTDLIEVIVMKLQHKLKWLSLCRAEEQSLPAVCQNRVPSGLAAWDHIGMQLSAVLRWRMSATVMTAQSQNKAAGRTVLTAWAQCCSIQVSNWVCRGLWLCRGKLVAN